MNAYHYRQKALQDPLYFVYDSEDQSNHTASVASLFKKIMDLYFRGTDAEKIQFFNDEFKRLSGEIDDWAEEMEREDQAIERNQQQEKYERENPVRPPEKK